MNKQIPYDDSEKVAEKKQKTPNTDVDIKKYVQTDKNEQKNDTKIVND